MASRGGTERSIRTLITALTIAAAIAAIFGTVTSTATAAPYATALHYRGGPVQHNPHVYVIYWGSAWTSSESAKPRENVDKFFETVSGSAWQGILTQYFDEAGPISSEVGFTSYIDKSVVKPPKEALDPISEGKDPVSHVVSEAVSTIEANHWPHGPDDQFMVAIPNDPRITNCGGAHNTSSTALGYLRISFIEQGYCEHLEGTASHEYAETVTDPDGPPSWTNSHPLYPGHYGQNEIADQCDDGTLTNGLRVNKLYDNHLHECVLSDPEPPLVYAGSEEATSVAATSGVLNGVVNPAGKDTSYRFEFGPTTSYGTNLPAEEVDVGAGWKNVTVNMPVEELEPGSTYHFRVVATNSTGTNAGEDLEFTTPMSSESKIPNRLENMPVTEPFDSSSQAEFETAWSPLAWATGSEPKGRVQSAGLTPWGSPTGWAPTDNAPTVNGAFYDATTSDAGLGVAVASTLSGDMFVGDHFSLWLDMPTSASAQAGYELRAAQNFADRNTVALYKWVEGTPTELTSWSTSAFEGGDSVALVDQGDAVSAWADTGSGFSQVLFAKDDTFGPGHAGLEAEIADAEGPFFVLNDFKAGALEPLPAATADAATEVKGRSATLNGTVNPEGAATSYRFEYDQAEYKDHERHGTSVPIPDESVGSGTSDVPVSRKLEGLKPGVTYHFRVVASNEAGTAYGRERTLTTLAAPKATTTVASEVGSDVATLNGRVNPEGAATSYRFEYDQAEYKDHERHGTSVPIPDESVGSGTSDVPVSRKLEGLKPGVTYHFRVVAESESGESFGEDRTFSTAVTGELAEMPLTEAFDGGSESLARFSANWSKLGWAEGSTPKGADSSQGWGPADSPPSVNGAYYSAALTNLGWGTATEATLAANPTANNHNFSLWLDMPTPGSTKAGYRLIFTYTGSGAYAATLYRWAGGVQTKLAIKTGYSLESGDSLALLDEGGAVSAWTDTGAGFGMLLSAADASYEGGYAGLEGSGNDIHVKDFRAAALQPPPKAATEAATEVKETSAKLNGTVNPEGSAASYYFEWGESTSYGHKTEAKSTGSGTSNVAEAETIAGLSVNTTYHFRIVAGKGGSTVPGEDKEFTTLKPADTAGEINTLPTLDALNRSETPLSNSGKWSALAWDTSTSGHNTGYDTTTGWGAYDASPAVNGAYWSPAAFNDKSGDAVAATMAAAPAKEGHYLALWLDMGSPGSAKSGYQLRWILSAGGTYTVKLSKWSAGKETELASNASVSIPVGTTMAISDSGGTLTAWQGSSGSLSSILSASDTAFGEGYAGIEVLGQKSRLTNFKAGRLLGGAIAEVAVLDPFSVPNPSEEEEASLDTSKWTKTGWTEQIGWSWAEPYHGYGAWGGHLAGAYWSPTTFSDAKGPVVAAATLGTGPISKTWSGEYLSLWLDMPNPGSARSGYEARFTGTNGTESAYKVELSKWVAGERTVLGAKEGFSLPKDTTFALTESGGSLTIWTGTGSLSPVVSATDSAYSGGYAGIEANKGEGTAYDFRAGGL